MTLRKRLFCLLLVLAALAALLPLHAAAQEDGAPQQSFASFRELQALCAQSYDDTTTFVCSRNEDFVLDENLSIPCNLHIQIPRLTIPSGRELTVETGARLDCSVLRIEGRLSNWGQTFCLIFAPSAGVTESETVLGEAGSVLNGGTMTFSGELDVNRFIDAGASFREYHFLLSGTDELPALIQRAENDGEAGFFAGIYGGDRESGSSLALPKNFTLTLHDASLRFPADTILSLDGSLLLYRSRVLTAGELVNNGRCAVYDAESGLEILEGGSYSGYGELANCSGSSLFPLSGVDPALFEALEPSGETELYRLPPPPGSDPEPEPESGPRPTPGPALRESSGENQIVILDELGLLTEEQRQKLLEDMRPITRFGSVAFWTTDEYTRNEVEQARLKRRELFGLESGVILVINMNVRKVSIQSYGLINETISAAQANTITNNVRGYLTRGQYYEGASTAFGQIGRLLEGGVIPQPMKYLSNACIALMLSLILMLPLAFRYASTFRKGDPLKMVEAGALAFTGAAARYLCETRTERPKSSGGSSCSSCSSGSSCSSCGSGGSSSF